MYKENIIINYLRSRIAALLWITLIFTNAAAASLLDGELDTSFSAPPVFSDTGIIYIQSIGVGSDGKMVIAGAFDRLDTSIRRGIARLNADGTLDENFTPSVNGDVFAILILDDGDILIGGDFTNVNGRAISNLARLNANGSVDSSFNTSVDGAVRVFFHRANGKILVGGGFNTVNAANVSATTSHNLAQLLSSGAPDPSFNIGQTLNASIQNNQGVFSIGEIIADNPLDNEIVIGGSFSIDDIRLNLSKLNNDGTLDTSFELNIDIFAGSVNALVVVDDNEIVFGGSFLIRDPDTLDDITLFLGKVDQHGDYVDTYKPAPNSSIADMHLLDNGNLIVVGKFSGFGETSLLVQVGVAILSPSGALVVGGIDGVAGDIRVNSVAVQPAGNIIVGGYFASAGTGVAREPRQRLARMNADGALLSQPNLEVLRAGGKLNAVTVDTQRSVYIGGSFKEVGAIDRPNLVKLDSRGAIDDSFNVAVNGEVTALTVQSTGQLIVGGQFVKVNQEIRPRLFRVDSSGIVDLVFPDFPNGSAAISGVTKILELSDGKLVLIGNFKPDGFAGDTKHLIRLNADGSLDTTFESNFDRSVTDFAINAKDEIIAVGDFDFVDSIARQGIARLLPNGSLDTSFEIMPISGINDWSISAVAVKRDQSILVGGTFRENGSLRDIMLLLDENGMVDSNFSANLRVSQSTDSLGTQLPVVIGLTIAPSQKVIVAGAMGTGDSSRKFLLRLNEDGSIDEGFFNNNPDSYVKRTFLQADGKMMVVGDFTQFNGLTTGGVVRVDSGIDLSELCVPIKAKNNKVAIFCL